MALHVTITLVNRIHTGELRRRCDHIDNETASTFEPQRHTRIIGDRIGTQRHGNRHNASRYDWGYTMAKIQKTFRLDRRALDVLEVWAKEHGTTVTGALEAAIFAYTEQSGTDGRDGSQDAAQAVSEAHRAALEEIGRLTSQVDALTRLLEREQELASSLSATIQATQTVAALERGAVAQADGTIQVAERRPTFWQRIKARF